LFSANDDAPIHQMIRTIEIVIAEQTSLRA
jgi:hypothetical protein